MNEHGNNQARPESDAAAERQNNQAASPRTETPVDVIAIAREATLREQVAAGMSGAIKLIAPAKVNLFLGIGALRDDGFHEALNVMHAVNLHDVLTMRVRPAEDAGAAAADGGAAPAAGGPARPPSARQRPPSFRKATFRFGKLYIGRAARANRRW